MMACNMLKLLKGEGWSRSLMKIALGKFKCHYIWYSIFFQCLTVFFFFLCVLIFHFFVFSFFFLKQKKH